MNFKIKCINKLLMLIIDLCSNIYFPSSNGIEKLFIFIVAYAYTVKHVYKDHSRRPENVAFMSSCPL